MYVHSDQALKDAYYAAGVLGITAKDTIAEILTLRERVAKLEADLESLRPVQKTEIKSRNHATS
jgi:hypothetical protein